MRNTLHSTDLSKWTTPNSCRGLAVQQFVYQSWNPEFLSLSKDIMAMFHKVFIPGVIALACALGFIGAFTTISLCEQFRLATVSGSKIKQIVFLFMTSIAAGGIAIWSVFYFSMASCRLEVNEEIIHYRFDTATVIVTLFVIPFISGLGIALASTDHCFNKSKKEIMDMFISRTSNKHTIGEIKRMGRFRILFIVCTHAPHRIIAGAIITGGALCLMPYLGISSLHFPGRVQFHGGHVVASVFMSMIVVIGGFWVFFRVLSIFSSMDSLRVLCAINGLVLCGIQFSWIVWTDFIHDPTVHVSKPESLSSPHFVIGVLSAAVIFAFVMLMYVLSDLRAWLLRTSAQLRQADVALASLMKKTQELHVAQHGHFQAPLEVINYSRKFMQGAYSRKGERSTGGMVVAPPLYNDFSFVDEATPSAYIEAIRHNGPSKRDLFDRPIRDTPSARHTSAKSNRIACSPETVYSVGNTHTTDSTAPNSHSNVTATNSSTCIVASSSMDANIMNMHNTHNNLLPSLYSYTSNDNTINSALDPPAALPEAHDASMNV